VQQFAETTLEAVLRAARWAVYRVGLRPKPGSVLYSPSRAYRIAFAEAAAAMEQTIARISAAFEASGVALAEWQADYLGQFAAVKVTGDRAVDD
jgi:hypothetical protein